MAALGVENSLVEEEGKALLTGLMNFHLVSLSLGRYRLFIYL